ncbi:hypothetical protein [Lichenicoccus roseus]|uniref:Glycine zipper 2TM domain-containing protein n=1 Tax=Lichenicoccus roseus TaxID=2683649 RepID=A0A5R9JDB5_9PROT|nr:hypothetical protein [Lichenicoccus roseus]TLU73386.1 hypothetical protein FE263_08305 [Lichenicoccus roseus]
MTSSRHPLASLFLAGALLLPAGGAIAQTAPGPDQPGSMQAPPDTRPADQPMANGARTKPSGGCLKYGAAGAVGGHFAHHHAVLGAVGGCAVGAYVKHRSKKRIAAGQQP